jgi:opacity protein-like surface antigen
VIRPPDQGLNILFDGTEIYSRTSNHKISLGITAGTGLRYMLNSSIALKLGVDYSRARSGFDYSFGVSSGAAADIPVVESEFLVRNIELSAGLAYSF